MNIEKLARKAIDKLRSDYDLPSNGFLAGGSIANLIWEFASGNKAVINDIDIFLLKDDKKRLNRENRLYQYENKETIYYDDSYGGINYRNKVNEYYEISESVTIGKINEIYYISNTNDPNLIIDSFDLNCVQIGYLIETDTFYWTKDFESFINTGDIKVVNLITPSHTSLRLVKKADELKATYDEFELKLLQHVLNINLDGVVRTRFKSRYKNIWDKYSDKLDRFFKISQDINKQSFIKINFNDDSKIYYLDSINKKEINFELDIDNRKLVFDDDNLRKIWTCSEFIFYMRNIYGDNNLKYLWSDLRYLFIEDYLDIIPHKKDLDLLVRLVNNAPKVINTLRGLKISEQIKKVKNVLEAFKDDPIIGISLLENHKIDADQEFDENTKLILELTVRKEIVNDTTGKVSKILC